VIDGEPLPEGGLLRKGVIYLVPAPKAVPKRELDPVIVEMIECEKRRRIREYLGKRKRAS
jgi:hypothetical protein